MIWMRMIPPLDIMSLLLSATSDFDRKISIEPGFVVSIMEPKKEVKDSYEDRIENFMESMESEIQCIILTNDTVLISQIESVAADIGAPDCKLTSPYQMLGNSMKLMLLLKNV